MKNLIKSSFLLVIMMVACEQSGYSPDIKLIETSSQIENVSVINGRLVFDTKETFENIFNSLKEKTTDELLDWQNKNFKGYYSVLELYERLSEEDIMKIGNSKSVKGYENIAFLKSDRYGLELVRTIDDKILAVLTNNEGLIQIMDDIFYLQYDTIKEIKSPTELELHNLIQSNWNNSGDVKIITHPVTRKTISNSTSKIQATNTCIKEYKSKRRFKLEATVTNTYISSGIYSKVKHQKKSFGIWFNTKANKMRLTIDGTFSQVNPINPNQSYSQYVYWTTGLSSNVSKLTWTWYRCFFADCDFSTSTGATSYFEGYGDNNIYSNCTKAFP